MKKQPMALDIPAPPEPFEGFSPQAFKFLHGLKRNNNKQWFEAHRSDYENDLRSPCKRLVEVMASLIEEEKLPLVADTRRSLFRINRDIRFSADKSPYKTHVGIVFPVKGLGEGEWTGMYMGMEPEGAKGMNIFVGGGAHEPSPDYLKKIRTKIAKEHKTLRKLTADKTFLKEYPEGLKGPSLSRPPKGYDEDHDAIDLLKMKSFEFGIPVQMQDLMSPKLSDLLIKKFKAGIGVLSFFKV